MTLGGRILEYRTARGMSQLALSEALGVSRQSVSKWETDASVPELDKLVAMSEMFGVSLDELVRGVKPAAAEPEPAPPAEQQRSFERRQIVGIILLAACAVVFIIFTLLAGPLNGIIYSSPFLLPGAICMLVRRHTVLVALWSLWLLFKAYFDFATGIRIRWVLMPFLYGDGMFAHALIAWAELISLLLLIFFTARPLISRKSHR